MTQFLNIERQDTILIVTMNHPETRNALTGNTAVEEFLALCQQVEQDTSIRAIILTAQGTVFSSGGNLKDMQRYFEERPPADATRNEYRHGIQQLTRQFYNIEVPVIAAVNGAAIGAGLDLACMCDIRIAAKSAKFAESFIRVGLIPGDGGAWLLPRIVGKSKAAELAFTGDMLNAAEALETGLVSQVVADDELLDTALALAQRIARNPADILRMTKRLLRESDMGSLETVLELSAAFQAIAHQSTNHEEAVRAFLEKRTPNFD